MTMAPDASETKLPKWLMTRAPDASETKLSKWLMTRAPDANETKFHLLRILGMSGVLLLTLHKYLYCTELN
jgi:hypothetical protein